MKILGSDYDGTLNYNGIDEKKKKALKSWHDAGNIFVLVSGRSMKSVLRVYNEQQFICDYLIADSGAVIMKNDGTIISDIRCDSSLIVPLLKLLFEKGCPWGHVLTNNVYKVYADPTCCKEADEYTLENLPELPYFNQICTALPNSDLAADVVACIREQFKDKLNPLQNGRSIDIVRADMNKAKGLHILMEHLGAKHNDVIVVGDNINDADMIREFKSYAMANGVDSIKELANYVTPGVAELIERELTN